MRVLLSDLSQSRGEDGGRGGGLYSLNLIGDHDGVLLADLGGSLCLVVVGAVVLVRVAVKSTEEVPTAAVEP